MSDNVPDNLITYGPNTNCTLALCEVSWSVLGYRPSLAASGTFIALFAITMIFHIVQGFNWRTWWFVACMILGCIDEILGYSGRVMLYYNPFSFSGFLIEQICITTAAVFFCAALYVTLARTVIYLDRSVSRFSPKLLYWIFIPCDILSLSLQAAGGAISSLSSGSNSLGVNVSLGGLSFQVFTMIVFVLLGADYLIRYHRSPNHQTMDHRCRLFLGFLSVSILLILGRCIYRIDELSDGYQGGLFRDEKLFYTFESVFVVVAVFCLHVAQPGFGMPEHDSSKIVIDRTPESGSKQDRMTVSIS